MNSDLQSQLAAAQIRIAQLENQIADSVIGSQIAEAAVRFGIRSEATPDFAARIRANYRAGENGQLVPREAGAPDFDSFVTGLQQKASHCSRTPWARPNRSTLATAPCGRAAKRSTLIRGKKGDVESYPTSANYPDRSGPGRQAGPGSRGTDDPIALARVFYALLPTATGSE
jgi:hypothetical protein